MEKQFYRRLVWSNIWHFCRDCRLWPTEHYVERPKEPDNRRLCGICQLKDRWARCDRMTGDPVSVQ